VKNTIKENREFKRMYAKAKSAVTPCMVVYCRRNRLGRNRLGVTVSTKLGGAVVRNRARRRLREVFRLAQPGMKQGWDMILVARARAVDGPWKKLTAAFDRACRELGVLEEQG
jgi:ribonuclease P protein component